MKKIVVLFVVLLAVMGFIYAQGGGGSGAGGGEAYSCMWSSLKKDCIDGNKNYCICVE